MKQLNWSTLKYMAVSPALLRWRVDHPRPETDALRLGRAIHCAVLEPKEFPKRWIVPNKCGTPKKSGGKCENPGVLLHRGWWYCRVKGHAPIEAKSVDDVPEGIEVLTQEGFELAKLCGDNVLKHKLAAKTLAGGKYEESIEWEDPTTGIACRGRLDCLQPQEVVDLKSTRKETPREIEVEFARLLHHGQIAWYHDGAIAAGLIPKDAPNPLIVVVTNVEPYDVAVFCIPDVTLEAGRRLYRDLIRRYANCQAAELWPGIGPDLLGLELPPWAEGMTMAMREEMEEF